MPCMSTSAHASSDPSGSNTPAAQPSEPAVTPTYTHSFDDIEGVWQGDAVQILHTSGLVLATLPTDFLAGSGDNSWSFVYKILAMVAQCDDAPVMVYDAQGAAVPRATEGAPRAGAYELRHPGGSSSSTTASRRSRHHCTRRFRSCNCNWTAEQAGKCPWSAQPRHTREHRQCFVAQLNQSGGSTLH